jgi:dTDP-4-dehydrorhamnose reductase
MALFDSVLITGGGGMLARAFRDLLTRRGVPVHAPPREQCDLTQPSQLVVTMDGTKPTLVLNCAAYTKVDLAEKEKDLANEINAKGVGNLAHACHTRGVPLVHISTDYVFDGTVNRPLQPSDPVGPKGVYGLSKLLGERLLQEFRPPRWLILRTAWLYGPGGPNFVQTMLNAAKAGKPLKVIDDQVGCPTFTYDLAEATLALLETDATGIYHMSNSGQTNWFEFTKAIMDEFGVTPTSLEPLKSADWKAMRPESANRPAYSVLDVTPYEQKTGRKMPDWRDGLRRYHELLAAGA